MALVFKIKHKETLRRWVVSQNFSEKSSDLSLTVQELELKVRELFRFAKCDVLVITYVDKEGDIVTLADDQDLVDACFVQGLNPLRLEVKTLENGHESNAEPVARQARSSSTHDGENCADSVYVPNLNESTNSKRTPKQAFPQATADAIKQFLAKHAQNIDPNLQPAVLIKNIQKALKDFVKNLVHEGQRLAPRGAPASSECPAYTPSSSQPLVCSSSVDNGDQVVHFGVRCDNCKLHPIRGLRYKSTKVFNYDLCSTCFDKMGNELDYQRIEKPVGLACHGKWMSPFASGSDGWKSECPFLRSSSSHPLDISKKYDASFMKDVSVFDGVELAPCNHFTRTLRLKNTGSMPWPQGTQLLHIGGYKLAPESAVVLKLPEGGLSVGLECNVSVDMRTPDKAGNYISHWCLMAPNGEKFGQSVWIAIQVVGETNKPYQSQVASTRDEMTQMAEETNKLESKVECAQISKVHDSWSVTESTGLVSSKADKGSPSVKQPAESTQFIPESKGLVSSKADEGSPSVKQPAESTQFIVSGFADHDIGSGTDEVDGFSMIEKPGDTGSFKMVQAPPVSSRLAFPQRVSAIDEQYGRMSPVECANQEIKLHELEMMGFNNRNLNAILLEKNKQDLQLTLDDLLLGSGWVNLLKDLQEMGFDDANTNLRLLIKNEGSIKRVVKELVELEKAESGLNV